MVVNQQGHLIIAVPKEFSFKENIGYMSRSNNECMFEICNGKVIKAIPVANEILLVEVSENPEGNLLIRFIEKYAPSSESVCDKVIHYVRDWFDLDTDLKPFYGMAEKDPLLQTSSK